MKTFDVPVGCHDFHKVKIIDFPLYRWHSLRHGRLAIA